MNQPLVVGYKGEIGSFILSGLLRIMPKALNIWCIDVNETPLEVVERINKSDVIFLCIPMQETKSWLVKFKGYLKNKIVIEQCSLKQDLFEDKRLKNIDIRSMHILFRPSQTPNLSDRKVALFEDQYHDVPSIITKVDIEKITQSTVVWYKNAKEHDKDMAIQQALLHRSLLILGKMLKKCNGSTYISQRVIELSERIKKGDKGLYGKIQGNKYLPDILKKMKTNIDSFNVNDFW